MKKTFTLVVLIMTVLVSCQKEQNPEQEMPSITAIKVTEGNTSVRMEGTYKYSSKINELHLQISEINDFSDVRKIKCSVDDHAFSVTVSDLKEATKYYYVFEMQLNNKMVMSDTSFFYTMVIQDTISTSANPSNGGTTGGGGIYNHGTSCTVLASANAGYTFVNWTENGVQVSTDANYTFTVNGNRNLVANFDTQICSVSASPIPYSGGATSGGGTYEYGASCTVTASANLGYIFMNWTENGTQVSTDANYTFTVSGNHNLKANFVTDGGSEMTFTVNGASFKMIQVQGGTFKMGSYSVKGSDADSPAHRVTLSTYYIGETEVTQALWSAVMLNNHSYFVGEERPVEMVSWYEAQEFIARLNTLTGQNFALPTEAEWEFAARGGNQSIGYTYSGSNTIGSVGWYWNNSDSQTHPVKTKLPNELGLYDMSGNVWEWCADWYGSYDSEAQTNPTGPDTGSSRVNRGGCWDNHWSQCGVLVRSANHPALQNKNFGFRLAIR